jgi:hypothetical protein
MLLSDAIASVGAPAPRGEIITFGGIHLEKHTIAADTVVLSHCHAYDHPSILASGIVELWRDDRSGLETLEGPIEVCIPAGVKHAICALTDAIWYCLHVGEPQFKGDA